MALAHSSFNRDGESLIGGGSRGHERKETEVSVRFAFSIRGEWGFG